MFSSIDDGFMMRLCEYNEREYLIEIIIDVGRKEVSIHIEIQISKFEINQSERIVNSRLLCEKLYDSFDRQMVDI